MLKVKNTAWGEARGGKPLPGPKELRRMLPALLAGAKPSGQPLGLLLLKLDMPGLKGQAPTPRLWERLQTLCAEAAAQAAPSRAVVGWWGEDILALLLPGHSREQALALQEGISRAFGARAGAAGFPWVKGECFLCAGAESAPPAGYCNLGRQAEKELQRQINGFLPPLQGQPGEEDLLGRFLAGLLAANDSYLARQGALAGEFAAAFGAKLGLGEDFCSQLAAAARLEDLGMLILAGDLLWKPGPLTPGEWGRIQGHPRFGAKLGEQLGLSRDMVQGIACHHEHWDGRGYPAGLAGEEIPLTGRILCAASVWGALLLPRPYRPALEPQEAQKELARISGRVLDPNLAALVPEIAGEKKVLACLFP